jgi:hypothetical protein
MNEEEALDPQRGEELTDWFERWYTARRLEDGHLDEEDVYTMVNRITGNVPWLDFQLGLWGAAAIEPDVVEYLLDDLGIEVDGIKDSASRPTLADLVGKRLRYTRGDNRDATGVG